MGKRKTILIVVPSNIGTIAQCSLNLYKALQAEPDIIVKCVLVHRLENGLAGFDHCEWCIGSSSSGIRRIRAALSQIWWLKKIKRKFKPDITISTLFGCSTISVLSGGKDKKIGIFHSPHTQVRSTGYINYNITLLIYRYIYPHLDFLYCVSNEVKNSILNTFKTIPESKVKVVYNIHDCEQIIKKSEEELSEEEMKIFSFPVILYCGRLDYNKTPERLLKAFARIKNIQPFTQLVFIGKDTDDLLPKLRRLAEDESINNRVHFFGVKPNPYKYMRLAKSVVSCSYSEGLPGVLIEALLLNTPVVTTNSSEGVWEILSCHEDYQPELNKLYVAKKGIITSNFAAKNKMLYDADIENIAEALNKITDTKFLTAPFLFKEKILAENLIRNYTDV